VRLDSGNLCLQPLGLGCKLGQLLLKRLDLVLLCFDLPCCLWRGLCVTRVFSTNPLRLSIST